MRFHSRNESRGNAFERATAGISQVSDSVLSISVHPWSQNPVVIELLIVKMRMEAVKADVIRKKFRRGHYDVRASGQSDGRSRQLG